ncbi:MAG: hypothetical protein ACOC0H_06440 [Thermodesulfobacteriota bacterium]
MSKTCITKFIIRSAGRKGGLLHKSALAGIFFLFIPLSLSGAAQAGDAWKDGWFGDLQIGGGVISARPSGLEVLDGRTCGGTAPTPPWASVIPGTWAAAVFDLHLRPF